MDEIEKGFSLLMEKIRETGEKKEELSKEILKREADLLGRMAESSMPVIQKIGLSMLQKGKQDTKGEVYDANYFTRKMIVLGKTDPVEFRPDDASKQVTDQFCVLSEDGKFYELMYSSDGFMIDTYLNGISPRQALDLYGYEVMFMLYRAMRDYLEGESALIGALETTLAYLFQKDSGT